MNLNERLVPLGSLDILEVNQTESKMNLNERLVPLGSLDILEVNQNE